MLSDSDGLPIIRLVSSQTPIPFRSPQLSDLRWLRVEEYFQARSLANNTQKAYRRELKRFLAWTDRAWADLTPRQIAQFKAYLQGQKLIQKLHQPSFDGSDEFLRLVSSRLPRANCS